MTIKEKLNESGLKFDRHDCYKIGEKIAEIAKGKAVEIGRVDESIQVNDYPENFLIENENIFIEHFQRKTNG